MRKEWAELEFGGPACTLRDIDLGIAVGSAAKTTSIHSIGDSRSTSGPVGAARQMAQRTSAPIAGTGVGSHMPAFG